MLGNPGSNPLELFWDLVDNLDQKLDAKIAVVEAAIKKHNDELPSAPAPEGQEAKEEQEGAASKAFKVMPETTKEELLSVVKDDPSVKAFSEEEIDEIHRTVRANATLLSNAC